MGGFRSPPVVVQVFHLQAREDLHFLWCGPTCTGLLLTSFLPSSWDRRSLQDSNVTGNDTNQFIKISLFRDPFANRYAPA
ncbi:MAG: hypothetical protein RML46_06750 [Anaerolineae bacterium]|nr:hypothetical protein [Anaerolineae bacterium]MDW8068593.1 hypothetical protein [Anaerolineae bacterium]